jgi:hypothetical protein
MPDEDVVGPGAHHVHRIPIVLDDAAPPAEVLHEVASDGVRTGDLGARGIDEVYGRWHENGQRSGALPPDE